MEENFSAKNVAKQSLTASIISPLQRYGIESEPCGVELAKVALTLAKKLALDAALDALGREEMGFGFYDGLPLDNLDQNIHQADALFTEWPKAECIVGNPPFQSKNKMQEEFGGVPT